MYYSQLASLLALNIIVRLGGKTATTVTTGTASTKTTSATTTIVENTSTPTTTEIWSCNSFSWVVSIDKNDDIVISFFFSYEFFWTLFCICRAVRVFSVRIRGMSEISSLEYSFFKFCYPWYTWKESFFSGDLLRVLDIGWIGFKFPVEEFSFDWPWSCFDFT